MHPLVVELVRLGRLPTDDQADAQPARADRWTTLVGRLHEQGPVSDDEAAALVGLLPEDESDGYGVAWTLVHVIESAPGWPLRDALLAAAGPWARVLEQRLPPAPAGAGPAPG